MVHGDLTDSRVQVTPDVLALYNVIETNFKPMSIIKDAKPHLQSVKERSTELARYGPHCYFLYERFTESDISCVRDGVSR